jgi:hypothetical protein
MDYVQFVYRPLAARAARQVLVGRNRARKSPELGRFTRADVDGLLKAAWIRYAEAVVKVPPEPTIGSRMNVRLACFTMAFFNALLGSGTDRGYAIELVSDATWNVYTSIGMSGDIEFSGIQGPPNIVAGTAIDSQGASGNFVATRQ